MRLLLLMALAFNMVSALANPLVSPGVSLALAQWRTSNYTNIAYRFDWKLSADRLRGVTHIEVERANLGVELILDWRQPVSGPLRGEIKAVRIDGVPFTDFRLDNDHIVIAAAAFKTTRASMEFDIDVPIATAGTGITHYRDTADGADYVYSLFVPADASTVFPCFDQPDLKARFEVQLTVPAQWSVFSNAPAVATEALANDQRITKFAATRPISTYVFAFAAGSFEVVGQSVLGVRMIAARSKAQRAAAESETVLGLNDAATRYFSEYFAQPFPFEKYDLILIPEFPYGGMEHAGATFLREDAIVFPAPPTDNDRLRRALLIFHETAHQWFGDWVTMRWFDDLWLKEGFANFMAAKAAEVVLPQSSPWVAFHSRKSEAYRTDVTKGTTAIHQPMDNLANAKSAYGNIVYNKAPAVLRQMEKFIGEDKFTEAVRWFGRSHAYGAADWRDLVSAYEQASGMELREWAQRWVDSPGMPEVRAVWSHAGGRVTGFRLEARDIGGTDAVWPQRLMIALAYDNGERHYQEVFLNQPTQDVPQVVGMPTPTWILVNAGDFGYGRFLLTPSDLATVLRRVSALSDPLERALLWESIWEAVRDAQLDPLVFLQYALEALHAETNANVQATLLARVQWAYRHYLSSERQRAIAGQVERALFALLRGARTDSERIALQRSYIQLAQSPDALEVLKTWLNDQQLPAGATLSLRDKHRVVTTLLLRGDADGERWLETLKSQSVDDAGKRYSYATTAARGNASDKAAYLQAWLTDKTLAEAWIEEALPTLNAPEHAKLTSPLFSQALTDLTHLARVRKIFFVNRWLEAFVAGQGDQDSLDLLRQVIAKQTLPEDLHRKLLEAEDTLARKVRVLETFSHAKP